MLDVIFCLLKNYHPMQKMLSVVIDVYKFGQKILTIGTFCNFLFKYLKTIPVKAAENAFLQHRKKYSQPALMKIYCSMLKCNPHILQGRQKAFLALYECL